MRLIIAAIGKLRAGPQAALIDDYAARIKAVGGNIGFTGPEIVEIEAPKSLSGPQRQAKEGELLLKAVPDGAAIFLLDERGKNLNSEEFSALLATYRDDGTAAVAFLIGGAEGHIKTLRDRARGVYSFGAATWPHMLVRVMLTEQLYRAMTILSGHPYHRS